MLSIVLIYLLLACNRKIIDYFFYKPEDDSLALLQALANDKN